jgi:hypothetical protein
VAARVLAAGQPLRREGPGVVVCDPSGNAMRLSALEAAPS